MQKNILTQELISRKTQYSFMKYIGLLPNPDRIISQAGRSYETLRDLKNDPHVWSCIQSRKSGILNAKWKIVSENAKSKAINDFFRKIDLNHLFSTIFEALLFGFQPIELIWEYVDLAEFQIVPMKFIALPQEHFSFSANGKLIFRNSSQNEQIELPEAKVICPQNEPTHQNPYGTALLSKCYWPCTFKNGAFRFWINFMERYGMPMLIGQYRRGASDSEINALADSLVNMAENSVIVAPEDIDIKLAEPSRTSSVELYYELIRTCNAEISKALLSQTLTTELDSGSYAASQTHYYIRKEVIYSDLLFIQQNVQKLINLIYDVNDVSEEPAIFTFIYD